MTARTLKQVAQAGLVLGFEWIAKEGEDSFHLFEDEPEFSKEGGYWLQNYGQYLTLGVDITCYPDLPPEKSLLKLSDIVEENK